MSLTGTTRVVVLVAALGVVAACSRVVPKLDEVVTDRRTEYKRAETLPDLEVPPDLTTDAIRDRMAIPEGGEVATYSTYQERVAAQRKARELEQAGQAALQKLENEQLLIVEGSPQLVWPRLREYFRARGYGLDLDDAELGVLETEWKENSEELTRDKYKVFAEAGEDPTTTVLYISHVGEQLLPQGEDLVWRPRPSEPQLAATLTGDLRDFLGGEAPGGRVRAGAAERVAQRGGGVAPARVVGEEGSGGKLAELINAGEGKLYLALQRDFATAWRATGEALGSAGVTVEQADRERGVYYVRVGDLPAPRKKGMWSRLAFWKDDEQRHQYRLSLTGVGDKTEVVVLDEEGRWDTSETAGQILMRLHDQLNRTLGTALGNT